MPPKLRSVPRRHAPLRRCGSTLVEQLVIMSVVGVLAAAGVTGAARLLDAAWVHITARDIGDLFALAREAATSTGTRTAVRLDANAGRIAVHSSSDTIARYDVVSHGGVRLETSRDSMAYAPSGLGFGAANLRVVLRKGASAETLTVSRLGRVRRE